MPIVPTYGDPRIEERPLAPAYKSVVPGAGARAGVSALGRLGANLGGQILSTIQQQERDKADTLAILDSTTKYDETANALIYDPQQGALTVKGKDALGLHDHVLGALDQTSDQISAGLANDRQRLAFLKYASSKRGSVSAQLDEYTLRESQAYDADRSEAALKAAGQDAIGGAGDLSTADAQVRLNAALDRGHAVIMDFAKRNSEPPEVTAGKLAAFNSSVHMGVIGGLVDRGLDQRAQAYYDEAKDAILPDQRGNLERVLAASSLLGQAQRETDKILAAGGTLEEQRQKAKALDDPKLRDEVTSRIEHEAAVREASAADAERAAQQTAYDIVEKTQNVAAIPPSLWATFSGGTRSALRSYAENLARGVPVQTDKTRWYALMRQSATDPEGFSQLNLLQYRHVLSDSDFEQMAALQAAIIKGDAKSADQTLAPFRTNDEILRDALSQYGIDSGATVANQPDLAKKVAILHQMVGARVTDVELSTGKKLGNDEIQRIVDGVLATDVPVQPTWFEEHITGYTPTTRKLATLSGDDLEAYREANPTRAARPVQRRPTIADVPADEVKQITEALTKHGITVTPDAILNLYMERTFIRGQGGRQ